MLSSKMQQKPKIKEKRLKGLNAQETQKNVTLHSCNVCFYLCCGIVIIVMGSLTNFWPNKYHNYVS